MIKAVIFDWSRTLYDSENNREFPEAMDILEYCKAKKYRLTLVSLVASDESIPGTTLESRNRQIDESPLKAYFEKISVTDSDKDLAINETAKYLGLPNEEILIVDDRTVRGIRYGNKNGYQTAWIQAGRFSNELPNAETGTPTYTIKSEIGRAHV